MSGGAVTAPSRQADAALDEQIEMLRHMIRSSRPHSGSEEAHDAWDDAIDKAYGVLDTVRAEIERLREERDALGLLASRRRDEVRAAEARARSLEDGLREIIDRIENGRSARRLYDIREIARRALLGKEQS